MSAYYLVEGSCWFPSCQNNKWDEGLVVHVGGVTHRMHLDCAFKAIENNACSFCHEPVDVESLNRLREKLERKNAPKSQDRQVRIEDNPRSYRKEREDWKLLLKLQQEELDLAEKEMRAKKKQIEEDEALARSLAEG